MSSEGSPARILFVIDIQRCLFDPPNPLPGSTKILRNLEAALARERAASPPTKGETYFRPLLLSRQAEALEAISDRALGGQL